MKKTQVLEKKAGRNSEDLRREYRFDYAKAQPNRFANHARGKSVVVVLAPDVAKVFRDGASVNDALRAIMKAVPRRRTRLSAS
jgi:hypothetical protein